MRLLTALVSMFLLLLLPASGFGQRTTASIRGTVTDTSGAVVRAPPSPSRAATGFTHNTVTNADGVYSFAELPVGTYTVEVALSGFKSAVRKGIPLNVADVRADRRRSSRPARSPESVTVEVAARSR